MMPLPKGNIPWNKGIKGLIPSEETRRKMSESHKGKPRSEETKTKLSRALKGRFISEEQRIKASKALKGKVPWNKGLKIVYSEEEREKVSESRKGRFAGEKNPNYGKHPSEETRHKIGSANRGKSFSTEIRKKLSAARTGRKNPMYGKHRHGGKNPNWRDGISSVSNLVRTSNKYLEWHQTCLIRDDFTCRKCGTRGGALNVHHKKPFARLLKDAVMCLPLFSPYDAAMIYTPLWDAANGTTLCEKCHRPSKQKAAA